MRIARYYCPTARETFSLLPDCLASHFPGELDDLEQVVATVDAAPSASGHSEIPGHEIAAHLARHDVNVEVHNVDGLGRSHARALMDEAIAADADLLVLGAYGHSRAREFVLGGVTRELLTGSSIPLLMAH